MLAKQHTLVVYIVFASTATSLQKGARYVNVCAGLRNTAFFTINSKVH